MRLDLTSFFSFSSKKILKFTPNLFEALISRKFWNCFPKSQISQVLCLLIANSNGFTEVFVACSYFSTLLKPNLSIYFLWVGSYWQICKIGGKEFAFLLDRLRHMFPLFNCKISRFIVLQGANWWYNYRRVVQNIRAVLKLLRSILINQEANFITDTCEKQTSLVSNTNYFYSWNVGEKFLSYSVIICTFLCEIFKCHESSYSLFNGLQCKSWVQFLQGALWCQLQIYLVLHWGSWHPVHLIRK